MDKKKKIIISSLVLVALAAGSWLVFANMTGKNNGADYTGTVQSDGMELYKTLILPDVSIEEAKQVASVFDGKVVRTFEDIGLYEIGFDNILSFEDLENKKESMESAGHKVLYNPVATVD